MVFEMTQECGQFVVWKKSRYNEYQVTFNDRDDALKFLKMVTEDNE